MVTKEHDAALLITTLPTVPGAQLTVAGQCASLTVKTNMETYVAEAWAEVDSQACDARTVADFDVSEGAIRVSVTEALARLTLAVPAAFEVSVDMSRGACDVDVAGWLEGSVDVSTDSGSVSVQTVKGMRTRLRTGAGDVSVGSVDGNLDAQTGEGSVRLGKVVGEEVRAIAGGRASNALSAKAIYAKRTELSSSGSMQVAVLATERGALSLGGAAAGSRRADPDGDLDGNLGDLAGNLGGDLGSISAARSKLGSLDGEIDVLLAGGALEIQAGEQLRRLRVVDASVDSAGTAIELHMPTKLAAEVSLLAASTQIDPKLAAREIDATAAAPFEPKAFVAASTPDRTPAEAVAFPAAAADAAELAADELAATEGARAQGLGLQPWRAALSEGAAPAAADERATRLRALEGRTRSGGSLQCAVEIVAPRRTVHLLPQDFFARFKLN